MIPHKIIASRIVVAAALLAQLGCGSGSQPSSPSQATGSGNFSRMAATGIENVTGTIPRRAGIANVTLSATDLIGGTSTEITVNLDQPAPDGGLAVQLKTSDASIVAIPNTVTVPSGHTSASVAATTSPVSADTDVAITALYADALAGTSLHLAPALTSGFTVKIKPSTLTIASGQSGSTTITTKIAPGYNQALQLTAAKVPSGVSVTFSPTVIPAPGAGTSTVTVTVPVNLASGTYLMRVKASDGKISRSARLTLNVGSSGPGTTFQGCVYKTGGHRYQAVRISVDNPGTYPFDAVLYRGATCDPSQFADEFGYGTPLNFGGFGYIFWFADFPDQLDTSAIWHVGSDQSKCVSYATAPDC